MRKVLLILVLFAIAAPAAAREVPADVTDAARAAAEANNRFAVDLYRRLDGGGAKNLLFSPYSISTALAMVREGAAGATAKQIDTVFHFPGDLATSNKDLRAALRPGNVRDHSDRKRKRTIPAFELNVANAVWGQIGLPFSSAFSRTLGRDYGAPLQRLDFTNTAKARATINAWVAKQTKDKIKDIVPPGLPTSETRMTLANAIYFKSEWQDQFQKRATKKAPFHGPDEDVEVDFMRQTGSFRYAENDDAQILEMPYRGRQTSMLVVLPKNKTFDVDHERLRQWTGELKTERVEVRFPKFEFTNSANLGDVLEAMGMPDAFEDGKADFSRMTTTPPPLFIGAVLHKAFIAVDENGTEAAAATVVMMVGSAMPVDPPKTFTADRPFLFLIRHQKTGAILFMGRVADPSVR